MFVAGQERDRTVTLPMSPWYLQEAFKSEHLFRALDSSFPMVPDHPSLNRPFLSVLAYSG